MRAITWIGAALLCWIAPALRLKAEEAPRLTGPTVVQGLRRADADGDGRSDLLLLEGRRVHVWLGRSQAMPGPTADATIDLPSWVTFVDGGPALGAPGLRLLVYGGQGLAWLTPPARLDPVQGAEPLAWRDAEKATFAPLLQAGAVLVPSAAGWRLLQAQGPAMEFAVTAYRSLTAPGPFLEDRLTVVQARPGVWLGRGARAAAPSSDPALWAIDGDKLRCGERGHVTSYDLSFLPPDGDSRLVDLDGDARPELMHRITTNRSGRYGFFRAREAQAEQGPSLRPAVSDLDLSGYQLEPELVDLDADGLRDFVVTTIAVDMPNTLRAVTSGKVSARTRAFINRYANERTFFAGEPDAEVVSEVTVKARFNYAGTIEVQRHLTLVVDGDYDGDGRRDLVVRTDDRTLSLYPGVAKGVWGPSPTRVAIPPLGAHVDVEAYPLDLNGDRRDELVLIYRGGPGRPDEVRWIAPLP